MVGRMTHPLTVAVLNQKGGVGKSMIAQNLAAAAHLRGRKTLVLDLDRQGTTIDWSKRRTKESKLRGITVVESTRVISIADFDEVTKPYDFVICDGPARLSENSTAAAVAADIVLIPMRVGHGEWWAAAETVEALDKADELRGIFKRKPVRRVYVLNEVFHNVSETKDIIAALEGVELLPVHLHHRIAYERARGMGEATVTLEPKGAAAKEVSKLCELIFEIGKASHGTRN